MTSNGLLLSVNKPKNWTSFDVVNKIRRTLGWKHVGHAGTLDPLAEGVLIILCGRATLRAREFMDLPKEYVARIRFGLTTTTDDLEGEPTSTCRIEHWSFETIYASVRQFLGKTEQVPPDFSAVKVSGKPSYARRRAGESVVLRPRQVHFYALDVLNVEEPDIDVRLECSRGTYVRSLARDLGRLLGWGGTLAALKRTAIGPYRMEHALALEEVSERASEFRSA